MNVYGQIITGADVREAVEATLRAWMPAYLGEIAAVRGKSRGDLPTFRSYQSATSVDSWPEDQLPACIIVAPGLAGPPEKHGSEYTATWSVGVATVNSASTREATTELVELYTAAIRSAVMQHPSLGDFASGLEWIDESYDELGFEESRTIAAGQVILGVQVDGVLDSSQGTKTPPVNPNVTPDTWPTVESTSVSSQGAP